MTESCKGSIVEHIGDLLSVPQGILVHGCNAFGVMGAGVALAIRKKWPQAFEAYRATYVLQGNKLYLGQIIPVQVKPGLWVMNAITQEGYSRKGVEVDYPAISEVFKVLGQFSERYGLALHFPLIGCGLGGGDWAVVSDLIMKACPEVDLNLWTLQQQ